MNIHILCRLNEVQCLTEGSSSFGLEYDQNLVACQNTNFEDIKKFFDVTKSGCDARRTYEQSLECCWRVVILCDSWTAFTKFTRIRNFVMDMWSGRDLKKIQATTRPDCCG